MPEWSSVCKTCGSVINCYSSDDDCDTEPTQCGQCWDKEHEQELQDESFRPSQIEDKKEGE